AMRLHKNAAHGMERRRAHLAELARALQAVSPLATLGRGYAVLIDRQSGAVIRSVAAVDPATRVRGILFDGEIALRVDDSG
ncbi:MAG: exodeoxyribonuclease VII large subunit, partial [Dokdonella sp.]